MNMVGLTRALAPVFMALAALSSVGMTAVHAHDTAPQQDKRIPPNTPNPIGNLEPVENTHYESIDADPALWVVKDADTTIYLFGTIHALKPNLDWFDEAIIEAFDKSDMLVLEQVEPDTARVTKLFGEIGIDSSGKTLRSKLTKDDRAKYDAAMKKLGLPVTRFDPFDPWAAAVTLQMMSMTNNGFSSNNGAERVLTSAAKLSKKPMVGLETMEYQLRIFDDLPQDMQIRFLIDGSSNLEEGAKSMEELVALWAAGNPEGLAALMNTGLTEPVLFDRLLTQRNANWAQWIHQRMDKPGTIFLAVGAGHLAGTTSVQHMLTAYGLKAERIAY